MHRELTGLPGVGAKVADCVCLMSLDQHEAIPVDTHVWQIASRTYLPELSKTKTLTERTYRQIGDFFRDLFGDYAGWAHSVLFTADLRKFGHLNTSKNMDKKMNEKGKTMKRQGEAIRVSKKPKKNGLTKRS